MIHTAAVALVDRDGEPCEHCQLEGRVIAVQIYFYDGEECMTDGCFHCTGDKLRDLMEISRGHITVEISEFQLARKVKEMEAA